MVDLWIGPAIVAALVSALITAAGWFVSSWQAASTEQRRREEKVHDFQVALRAEIASDLLSMVVFDRGALLESVKGRYRAEPGYSVLVPHLASNVIFDSIVKEIHILPGEVIAPVVDYARLRQTLERFASDLRAPSFAQLAAERQLTMYSDYLETLGRLEKLAKRASLALDASLGISSPDAAQSTPPSALAEREAEGAPVVTRDGT
jgi:hypothetical protein